jgi:elongation factor G
VRGPRASEAGTAPEPRAPALIRNIAVVGHTGAGKTTLVEALLVRAGAINRAGRVEDGTTTCDADEAEQRLGHSVSLAVAQLEHAGVKLTLLDTPGGADFVGELRAGLRAADAALFVVSAVGGLDAVTVQLWAECAAVGIPRAVVVTQVDKPRADVDEVIGQCRHLLDAGVQPLTVAVRDSDAVTGVVRLLELDGAGPHDAQRAELIEAVIAESEDETLLDRYLGGEALDLETLTTDLEKAVARGHFHPALPVAALQGVGVQEVLDLLVQGFPSPLEHAAPAVTRPDGSAAPALLCDPDGPLAAEVVKTTTDPYLGRVSYVRVFSGTLRPDTPVHVSGHGDSGAWHRPDHPDHDVDERIGPLSSPMGATQRPIGACPAGDVCAVAKLASAETGDTLSSREEPLLVAPWVLPEPQLPVAVEATSRSDEERLGQALARLVAEDPTLRLERRADTGQQLLWCMGAGHADVLLDRLRVRHGLDVTTPEVQVPLRATLASAATVTGRHVKQSGGHGQYAVVVLEVAPGPPGSGIVFSTRVVGGSVPGVFHGSVEKGVRAQAERGVDGSGPLVDVEVVLVDGKAHSVDSSDAAFQSAGALAVREAASAAGTITLEPWCRVAVEVPTAFVGPVMSDLAGRRARVTGSEPSPGDEDQSFVHAELPEVELLAYATVLRGVSHGTGRFTRRAHGYEPAPVHARA